MIGSACLCAGCGTPMRSCVMPAYCFNCDPHTKEIREKMEKDRIEHLKKCEAEEKPPGGMVYQTPAGKVIASADLPVEAVLDPMAHPVLKKWAEEDREKMKQSMERITPDEYQAGAHRTEADPSNAVPRLSDVRTVRLLHGAMGLVTEAGELMGALKKSVFYGKPLDLQNISEENGDICWYVALICNALGDRFESVLLANLRKLRARFPEKFSEHLAADENRDLEAEKQALLGDPNVFWPFLEAEQEESGGKGYRPTLPPAGNLSGTATPSHSWSNGVCELCGLTLLGAEGTVPVCTGKRRL